MTIDWKTIAEYCTESNHCPPDKYSAEKCTLETPCKQCWVDYFDKLVDEECKSRHKSSYDKLVQSGKSKPAEMTRWRVKQNELY